MIDIFDGFTVNIFYDENDKDFVANFVELPLVSAFGSTPDKVLQELKMAWEWVKQSHINQGEQVPTSPLKNLIVGNLMFALTNACIKPWRLNLPSSR